MGFLADIVADCRPRGAWLPAQMAAAPAVDFAEWEAPPLDGIADAIDSADSVADSAADFATDPERASGPAVKNRSEVGVVGSLPPAQPEAAAPEAALFLPRREDRRADRGEEESASGRHTADPLVVIAGLEERSQGATTSPRPSFETPHPLAPSPTPSTPLPGRGGTHSRMIVGRAGVSSPLGGGGLEQGGGQEGGAARGDERLQSTLPGAHSPGYAPLPLRGKILDGLAEPRELNVGEGVAPSRVGLAGDSLSHSGRSELVSEDRDQARGHREVVPGDRDLAPSDGEPIPGVRELTLRDRELIPDDRQLAPDDVNPAPGDRQPVPDAWEPAPGDRQLVPEDRQSTLDDGNLIAAERRPVLGRSRVESAVSEADPMTSFSSPSPGRGEGVWERGPGGEGPGEAGAPFLTSPLSQPPPSQGGGKTASTGRGSRGIEGHPDARDEWKGLGGRSFPAPRSFRLGTRPQDDFASELAPMESGIEAATAFPPLPGEGRAMGEGGQGGEDRGAEPAVGAPLPRSARSAASLMPLAVAPARPSPPATPTPRVSIGTLEIVITAPESPAPAAASEPLSGGLGESLASRFYLRSVF